MRLAFLVAALLSARVASADHTAAEVTGAPRPGDESGRLDGHGPSASLLRRAARVVLYVPKVAIDVVLFPIHTAIWAEDRYQVRDRYYRLFFSPDRTQGVYPTLDYESGIGVRAGVAYVDSDVFGAKEHLAVEAATGAIAGEPYRLTAKGALRTGERLGRLELRFETGVERRPYDPYYGTGNTDVATPAHYRYREQRGALGADVHLPWRTEIIGTGAVTDLAFDDSTMGPPIEDMYTLTGFGGVQHVYGELELRADHRARASRFEPRNLHGEGWLAAAFAGRVHRLDDGPDFWRYGGELQAFLRLARGPRLLAFRLHGEAVSGQLSEVPFTELPRLGGGDFLRGYDYNRFRDRAAAVASAEYVWDLSRWLQAAAFVDAGRVYSSVDALSVRDLRVGYGLALEVNTDHDFLFEASVASSIDGGVFLNLSFNPVFDARQRWR